MTSSEASADVLLPNLDVPRLSVSRELQGVEVEPGMIQSSESTPISHATSPNGRLDWAPLPI